ncbi:hypothetical protein RJ639_028563, partial [Escallonia herrerae]
MEKQVAIVGAGISGLLARKHSSRPAASGIGGVWSQTIESTKLQTPKDYYQFSDFAWPSSVKETLPDHNQVMEYLQGYARHFKLLPFIKFNTKVVAIDYVSASSGDEGHLLSSRELWGGTGEAFSSWGKWNVVVQEDLNKGPEAFHGEVIHSMDYAAMDKIRTDKLVTVVGSQKSALDVAAQVAKTNEFMIHKPHEGFFPWLLAILLSPMLWIFIKLVESYLKWIYPLKKYNMVPNHSFFQQIVRATPLATDLAIFATGHRSDEIFANIFTLTYFQKCITGSSAPFY